MLKLSELAGRTLRWTKADRGSCGGYVLRDGEETVATLRFRSSWGSFATAESGDGSWMTKFSFATETGESLVRF